MVTVNTGRRLVDVRSGQLWKSLDPRDNGRMVTTGEIGRLRITVRNWKSGRTTKIYLQDFVGRYQFVKDYVVDPEHREGVK